MGFGGENFLCIRCIFLSCSNPHGMPCLGEVGVSDSTRLTKAMRCHTLPYTGRMGFTRVFTALPAEKMPTINHNCYRTLTGFS